MPVKSFFVSNLRSQFDLKKKSGPESKKTLSSVGKKTKGSERHDDLFDDIVK